jgi:hypothetical protein
MSREERFPGCPRSTLRRGLDAVIPENRLDRIAGDRVGDWKRDYGRLYPGTEGETPDTDKRLPSDHRASSRPYQL